MELINAVALALQISENQIQSIEEWAKVYFVRFNVGRPTFVSKAKVNSLLPFTFTLSGGRRGSKPWVAQITGLDGGAYGFARRFVEPAGVEWAGKKGCKSATFAISKPGIYQDSESGYYRVWRNFQNVFTYEDITYEEVRHTFQNKPVAGIFNA